MHFKSFIIVLSIVYIGTAYCQDRSSLVEYISILEPIIDHNPDSVIYYSWETSNENWAPNSKYTYEFNNDRRLIKELELQWKDNNWELLFKKEVFYDDSMLIEESAFVWDWYYKEWVNSKHLNFTFNSIGSLLSKHQTIYNEDMFVWENDSLFEYTYNDSFYLSQIIEFNWFKSLNDWEGSLKHSYEYDTIGNLLIHTQYLFEFDLMVWEKYKKSLFIYNEINELFKQIQLSTNNDGIDWTNEKKYQYTYYSNGLIQDMVCFRWVFYNSNYIWLEDFKISYVYNEQNQVIEQYYYLFDWDLLIWENRFFTENTYDSENRLSKSEYFDWKSNKWIEKDKQTYYYDGYTSKILSDRLNKITLYPNPAKDVLFINIEEFASTAHKISVFNILGQEEKIKNVEFSSEVIKLNISNQSNGVYLIQVSNGDNSYSSRFIIAE
ncbi:MAG: T9SS type A sorting domain-containing protein [Salinivirgaceae bacterium]|jgi:hypothetical protein|nr:T9SS type A sorting domain-containing protein [Salinivirgaceae bacterium]